MNRTLSIVVLMLLATKLIAQKPVNRLTYDEVMQLAKDQSPQAIVAKHRFRAAYWQNRTYVAELRPNLTLTGTIPQFSRSIIRYQNADGSYTYIEENSNTTSLGLSLSQNIGLTGGQIFVRSDL